MWNEDRVRDRINNLRELYDLFGEQHDFKPGMIARWKPGLKNKKKPDYDEPAIVVEVLETPIIDKENGGGSAYFREPLDLVLGVVDDDGDFVLFHFDSRRFETMQFDED